MLFYKILSYLIFLFLQKKKEETEKASYYYDINYQSNSKFCVNIILTLDL